MKAILTLSLFIAILSSAWTPSALSQTGTKSVTGFAFVDANGNGEYDEGEEILRGVDVFLIDADNNVVATATSDENGNYIFPDVPYGVYTIMVQVDKNSYVQSPQFTVDASDEDVVVALPVNDGTLQYGPSPLLTAVQEFIQMSNNASNPKTDNPASGFTPVP